MSIRKKLAFFIFLMTGFLVLMGCLFLLGRPIIIEAFRQSLSSMDSLDSIRELRSTLVRERTSLNRYLLLDDNQELLTFEEAARHGRATIETLKSRFGKTPPEWFPPFAENYLRVAATADRVTAHYKGGNKAKAYEEATSLFENVLKTVAELEKQKSVEAQAMFERTKTLTNQVEAMVWVALITAFILGIIIFQSLYRSVMTPLEVLKQGAVQFGTGHLDHRIDLPSENEFGELAKAFNTMAENVKQLQMQAVHMDRMSAVGQLAGGVAHEINNPLTAVLGQAQILLAKTDEKDATFASLTKIEQAALRCKKIVRGLLDFSRPSQSSFEEIDVNNVITATLELCEADLKKARVNVEKKMNKGLPAIEGNSSELQQVFLNLFNNAIQAMPRGGTLSVDARTHNEPITMDDRRKGAPPRKVNGPWVEINVKDNGIGIPKEHLNRVFEPFFTTKEIGKGTGLGLAVSLGIVQKHGGDLRVESSGLNKGASFLIILPVKKGVSQAMKRPGMAA